MQRASLRVETPRMSRREHPRLFSPSPDLYSAKCLRRRMCLLMSAFNVKLTLSVCLVVGQVVPCQNSVSSQNGSSETHIIKAYTGKL